MVNITKRMNRLMPKLLQVRGGAGASIVHPDTPNPQLTSVVLRIPNPSNGHDGAAHLLWRKYFPALRYHNLTLPIRVEQKAGADASYSPTLTLQFEATTREALENQDTKLESSDAEVLAKLQSSTSRVRPSQMNAEVDGGSTATKKESNWVDRLRRQQEEQGIPKGQGSSVGEITVKAQAAADPSAPSTTSPPATIYQRTLTLGLRGRQSTDAWNWFERVTGARRQEWSKEDHRQSIKLGQQRRKGNIDRSRVKAGIDAMRREKEELKRAREAAERLQSEA